MFRQHRLGQYPGHAEGSGYLHQRIGIVSRHHHQIGQLHQGSRGLVVLHGAQKGFAIHARHHPIDQAMGKCVTPTQQLQAFFSRCHTDHVQSEVVQHVAQHLTRDVVVINDQHPCVGGWLGHGWQVLCVDRRQRHFNDETGALTGFAEHRDRATHQFKQALGDGQAQPRATKLAGGGAVSLGEFLEQAADLFRCHANASVLHTQHQCCRVGTRSTGNFNRQFNGAHLGELDSV